MGQLKRGTLGTGIKEHGSGTEVVDASGTQTIPYADTVYTNTFTGDGSTATFTLSQAPSSASELDIFIGGQRLLLTSEDGSTINYSVGRKHYSGNFEHRACFRYTGKNITQERTGLVHSERW